MRNMQKSTVVLILTFFTLVAVGVWTTAQNPPGGYGAPANSGGGSGGGSGSGGGGGPSAVLLSPNCTTAAAPCIQLPAIGGCFTGAITNSTSTITFVSGFPPGIQVGMEAWVQLEKNGLGVSCSSTPAQISGDGWSETNYCGSTATSSPPVTVVSIIPNTSVTLSSNASCNTQNGTNSVIYYGFNVYSQFNTACKVTGASGGSTVLIVGTGAWVLDNVAISPSGAPVCGTNGAGSSGAPGFLGIIGNGMDDTYLLTPPWYKHNGDTGTVFAGGSVAKNFTLDGTWTNLGLTHGTPFDSAMCNMSQVRMIGYNYGNGATSEMLYPAVGGVGGCSIKDSQFITGNRGITTGGGNKISLINDFIYSQSMGVFNALNGANTSVVEIIGGDYECFGVSQNGSGCVGDHDNGITPTGQVYKITNADICQHGNAIALNANDTSGDFRISNTRINQGCTVGTNATGISLPAGATVRLSQTNVVGSGTGNTINNAGTLWQDNETLQNSSGGAGYTGAGTNHHAESGVCTFSASTTCAVTFSESFGTATGLSVAITPYNPGAITFTIGTPTATGFTITGSSSNSLAVGWSARL